MSIQASEISAILKDQIKNFGKEAEVAESTNVPVNIDSVAEPESYPNAVITVIKTRKKESAEALKYWMGLENNE